MFVSDRFTSDVLTGLRAKLAGLRVRAKRDMM
jgi:hypothetical protein